jgi:hypothetical protein
VFRAFNKLWNNKYKPEAANSLKLLMMIGKFPLSLDKGRSQHVYINQRLQIEFEAPDDDR